MQVSKTGSYKKVRLVCPQNTANLRTKTEIIGIYPQKKDIFRDKVAEGHNKKATRKPSEWPGGDSRSIVRVYLNILSQQTLSKSIC